MKIVASTGKGFLIEGSSQEVEAILAAVNGKAPKDILIGQKIPAIDYAQTIVNVKKLKEDYYFKQIVSATASFNSHLDKLKSAVEEAADIKSE